MHEWRHHWQVYNVGRILSVDFDFEISYKEAIIKYYRSATERDALLFSNRVAPEELSLRDESWVMEGEN